MGGAAFQHGAFPLIKHEKRRKQHVVLIVFECQKIKLVIDGRVMQKFNGRGKKTASEKNAQDGSRHIGGAVV